LLSWDRGLVGAFFTGRAGQGGNCSVCPSPVTAASLPPDSGRPPRRVRIYTTTLPLPEPCALLTAQRSASSGQNLGAVTGELGRGRQAWGEGEHRAAPRWGSTGAPGRRRRTCASWHTSRSTATPTGARCPSKQVAAATSWALQNECAWRVAGGRGECADRFPLTCVAPG